MANSTILASAQLLISMFDSMYVLTDFAKQLPVSIYTCYI